MELSGICGVIILTMQRIVYDASLRKIITRPAGFPAGRVIFVLCLWIPIWLHAA